MQMTIDAQTAPERFGRLIGFLYIFSNATAFFGFWVRSQILEGRDPVATSANVLAYEPLFRAGLAAELVTIVATTGLVAGTYALLRPIDRPPAFLAVLLRVLENAILASLTFASFAAMAILQSEAAEPRLLQGIGHALIRVHLYGFQVGFLFLGLGSALFSWLWLRSGYIPRSIAAWGIFASLIMAVISLALIISPGLLATITLWYMAPMGLFEIGLGFWLLIKGIAPTPAASPK